MKEELQQLESVLVVFVGEYDWQLFDQPCELPEPSLASTIAQPGERTLTPHEEFPAKIDWPPGFLIWGVAAVSQSLQETLSAAAAATAPECDGGEKCCGISTDCAIYLIRMTKISSSMSQW